LQKGYTVYGVRERKCVIVRMRYIVIRGDIDDMIYGDMEASVSER